jgi:3-hydroxyacyl-CoA dehydrogenase
MGPFELMDVIGLDVTLEICKALHAEFREPGFAPAPLLGYMVSSGYLGRKAGTRLPQLRMSPARSRFRAPRRAASARLAGPLLERERGDARTVRAGRRTGVRALHAATRSKTSYFW